MTYLNFETNIIEKLNRLDYLKKTEVSSGHSIDKSNNQLFVYVFVSISAKEIISSSRKLFTQMREITFRYEVLI